MLSLFSSIQASRTGCAAAFSALLLLASSCEKQAPLTAHAQPDHYYLNGEASSKQAIDGLDAKTIANVNVLSGKQAIDYTHDSNATGAVLVQTK